MSQSTVMMSIANVFIPAVNVDQPRYGGLERANELFGQWNTQHSFEFRWLGVALAVLAVILLIAAISRRLRERRLRSQPLATFHRLASEVGVNLRDQWLLMTIARRQALPSPLTLLLSRATLHHHARAYAQHLHPGRRLRVMRRVAALRQLLYS